jgi:hypothetical protein
MATDFRALIAALADHEVDFVVIGGVALVLRGSPRSTADFDICYSRQPANLARLAAALLPLSPTLRGAPPDLPFRLDERTLRSGLNFTLSTTKGDIDILGEVTGIGGYERTSPTWLRSEKSARRCAKRKAADSIDRAGDLLGAPRRAATTRRRSDRLYGSVKYR